MYIDRVPARVRRIWILLTAVVMLFPSCVLLDRTPPIVVELPFEHYTLENGLEVILRKDDRIPVVSVNVWYHVGPANEIDGRRGFAHLFEHMMLQGSGHAPGDYIARLEAVGATGINANTDFDRTSYLQDVPSDQLELAMWAESDRMGFLLDALDEASLRNQQSVIRNERRQRIDNAPYGLAHEEVYRLLFPPDHPYHHYIFGSHAEMQAAELDEVEEFFRRYYGPNNASLAIVGNIDIEKTKAMIDRYFGTLPRGEEVPEVPVKVPRIPMQKRTTVTDTVELPRVLMAWISPPAFSEGDARASLAARMLGGGKASRLFRDLVHDLQIAQSVTADNRSLSHGSVFQITATAKPGHTVEELETAIRRALDRMAEEGPGEKELAAAKLSTLAVIVKSLEPSEGVADRLNAYNHFVGDPGYLAEDLKRFQDVDEDHVRDFVREALAAERGVVVAVNPGPKPLPDDPPAPPPVPRSDEVPGAESAQPWRHEVPGPVQAPRSELPVPRTFELENGLTVYLVGRPELPLVTVQLTARSGSSDDPSDLPGLASFTSAMLDEGAGERDAIQIANDLTALGSTLDTGASREASWVVSQTLEPHLEETMAILSDVVLRPQFGAFEISRTRTERLASLQQQRSQPLTTAFKVMWREHYGEAHPYGHLTLGTEHAIARIDRADLIGFHRRAFTPHNSALILAGDLDQERARELAEDYLGDWEGPVPAARDLPEAVVSPDRLLVVDMPDAPQTALVVSQPGVARDDPEYDELLLVNGVLGGMFSSRLNQSLRERHGFTYGVDSQVTQSRHAGLLHVSMSVDKNQTGASVREILGQATDLRERGLTEQELNEARQSIVRSLPNSFRTNAAVAASIAHLYALGLPQDYFRGLEDRLSAVTVGEAAELSARLLRPELMKVVAVGDRAAIEQQLTELNLGPPGVRSRDAVP